jgi:phosphatidylglycerophosphate synthase
VTGRSRALAPAPRPQPGWIAPVPNLLTGLRLLLAAAFPFVPAAARIPVVVAAGLSDFLDGWIARRFHAESHLGRLLDGVADKAFVVTVLLGLAVRGEIAWIEAVLLLARDAVVVGIAAVFAARRRWEAFGHMRARGPGKATTALAFAWFVAVLIEAAPALRWTLFGAAALASVVAAVDYLAQAFRETRSHRAGGALASHPLRNASR